MVSYYHFRPHIHLHYRGSWELSDASSPACAFTKMNNENAAAKQSRIHRISARPEERERSGIAYREDTGEVARLGTNQQICYGKYARDN